MNLDKLKKLEAKATPGKIGTNGGGSIVGGNKVLFFFNDEQIKVGKFDEDLARAQLICALRNSAKEMIETIERYKAALDGLRRKTTPMRCDKGIPADLVWTVCMKALYEPDKALKEPEKALTK